MKWPTVFYPSSVSTDAPAAEVYAMTIPQDAQDARYAAHSARYAAREATTAYNEAFASYLEAAAVCRATHGEAP